MTYNNIPHSDVPNFDHYELIPRNETLKPPLADHPAHNNTKPYLPSNDSSKTEEYRAEEERERQERAIREDKEKMEMYVGEIGKLGDELRRKSEQHEEFMRSLKAALEKYHLLDSQIVNQVREVVQKLKKFQQTPHQNTPQSKTTTKQTQDLLRIKQQEIRRLKSQLLQSTTNNINTIFNSELTETQILYKEISSLKDDIRQIVQQSAVMAQNRYPHEECRHEDKILGLIRSYEEMLKLYHSNERTMYELKNRQEENFTYFNSLHSELNHSVYQICSTYTNKRLAEIENHVKGIVQNLKNQPERVKTQQEQDIRVRELLNQIEHLNEKITQRQIQIQKMRESNQQLMMRSRVHDRCELELQKMRKIEQKVREKDHRISQLQNTIIQQMQSKIRADSVNSQQSDVEKQKNNIRNLKALVSDLKLENKTLKTHNQQLTKQNKELKKVFSNMSSSSDVFNTIQKVNKDEASLKVVEDIVGVLVHAAEAEAYSGKEKKCKCLELTTDCLIGLNQEYPELEVILEELGIIQKTANLLPIHL